MSLEFPDEAQFDRFCRGILRLWGIDLSSYGQRQLHRRLRFMMERAGDSDLDAFLEHLARNRELSVRLKDQFTINVSEFFRDAHLFARLETMLRPRGQCHGARKIWSAGCSYGAEPYSLAIMLKEHSPHDSWQVIATDIDRQILARARQGVFTERELRNVSPTSNISFYNNIYYDQ